MIYILLISVIGGAYGFQTGAPVSGCATMIPGHDPFTPKTTPSPYSLSVYDASNETNYVFNASIVSSIDFGGFLLMARSISDSRNETYTGQFLSMPALARKALCGPGAEPSNNDTVSAVTHASDVAKRDFTFEWTPDLNSCGQFEFVATIATSYSDFWGNVTSQRFSIPCPVQYNDATTVHISGLLLLLTVVLVL